jgi:hypothetical protein
MKPKIEDWDESILDVEDYKAERALQRAALEALQRARRCGTDFVIREQGRVKSLKPNETAPYEKQMLVNLDRLNRKIAELQNNPLTLNDRPQK